MRFVVHKIGIALYCIGHPCKLIALLQFYIHHTAMYACSCRNGNRQSISYPLNSFYSHRVAHTHAWTKIGVCNSAWRHGLHQCAYYRIASRIPSCRNNRYSMVFFSHTIQRCPQRYYIGMNIKAINRVYTLLQNLYCSTLSQSAGQTHDSHIHLCKVSNGVCHLILLQLNRYFINIATHHTCHFKIGSMNYCINNILTYIAIANNGCSYFLICVHKTTFYLLQK